MNLLKGQLALTALDGIDIDFQVEVVDHDPETLGFVARIKALNEGRSAEGEVRFPHPHYERLNDEIGWRFWEWGFECLLPAFDGDRQELHSWRLGLLDDCCAAFEFYYSKIDLDDYGRRVDAKAARHLKELLQREPTVSFRRAKEDLLKTGTRIRTGTLRDRKVVPVNIAALAPSEWGNATDEFDWVSVADVVKRAVRERQGLRTVLPVFVRESSFDREALQSVAAVAVLLGPIFEVEPLDVAARCHEYADCDDYDIVTVDEKCSVLGRDFPVLWETKVDVKYSKIEDRRRFYGALEQITDTMGLRDLRIRAWRSSLLIEI